MIKIWKKKKPTKDINPDEIFLDSANLSSLDMERLEGKKEEPISPYASWGLGILFLILSTIFLSRVWMIQVVEGSKYREIAENNRFRYIPILAERGVLYSRDGKELAWNDICEDRIPYRAYVENVGMAHVLGYSKPPMRDKFGVYYREEYEGIVGVEKYFNETLKGKNGLIFIEHDAQGKIYSENLIQAPISGENLTLTIDSRLQEAFHLHIKEVAELSGFKGGAGLLMDIHTGELLVATSFPEYSSVVMTDGEDIETINQYIFNENKPFMNRFAGGVFTPGSVIKPFVAVGVLEEGIIDANVRLDSPGTLSIPNPYDPSRPSTFRDWQSHGSVNLYEAIAVSSNVYFYKVGGGYQSLDGLGISQIEKYLRFFGFGEVVGSEFPEREGNIPTPAWKEENFSDGTWRVGDTYNTTIGQFGFQATPLQMVRATAALSNGGYLLRPTIMFGAEAETIDIGVGPSSLEKVSEGMRMAVTEGTAIGLNKSFVKIAAKTGTAQTGLHNQFMNSWIVGFFPYDDPKYAFTIVMDESPSGVVIGGVYVMSRVLDWMREYTPEYFESGDRFSD